MPDENRTAVAEVVKTLGDLGESVIDLAVQLGAARLVLAELAATTPHDLEAVRLRVLGLHQRAIDLGLLANTVEGVPESMMREADRLIDLLLAAQAAEHRRQKPE